MNQAQAILQIEIVGSVRSLLIETSMPMAIETSMPMPIDNKKPNGLSFDILGFKHESVFSGLQTANPYRVDFWFKKLWNPQD